ncbi:MAG TPA: HEAT repeat domain-containing protein, partial [Baekduia sp.]|nr:HEAT repeat domain-containing protein [Baekduia sp.]
MTHQEAKHRRTAAFCIREMRPVPASFIPALLKALDDEDTEVRQSAAAALGEVGTEIETVGALTESATLKLNGADQRHQGFAARLRIIRQLSADLMTPSNRIAELGQLYGAQLRTVDPMVREVIRQGHAAETDEDKAAAAEAFRSLLGLVAASDGAIKALQG